MTQSLANGGASADLLAFPNTQQQTSVVSFDRRELSEILKVYGRMVASGEWRDYAIDMLKDRAVFSIFRRSSEMPLYRIVKDPKLSRRQGAYQVVAAGGQVLKRGHDLTAVLRVFDRQIRLADNG
ncbi:DUF2794 domain-containing protein [Jiella sp. MQZ9-1]|uniref:DUF2794 domain-containing protein n=1 Tax=Jiella flava TaxID=2816857 RepID=UPI001E2A38A6|nr:DUF2794 domain-containing protein [Jiella flava]MCD2469701.1 DUF2794 domain-containing protein [Jiella flava]